MTVDSSQCMSQGYVLNVVLLCWKHRFPTNKILNDEFLGIIQTLLSPKVTELRCYSLKPSWAFCPRYVTWGNGYTGASVDVQ